MKNLIQAVLSLLKPVHPSLARDLSNDKKQPKSCQALTSYVFDCTVYKSVIAHLPSVLQFPSIHSIYKIKYFAYKFVPKTSSKEAFQHIGCYEQYSKIWTKIIE